MVLTLKNDSRYLLSMFSSLYAEKLNSNTTVDVNISSPSLSRQELNNLSRTNGIIKRAIYEYPKSASNSWIDLNFSKETNLKNQDVLDYLMRIPYYTNLQKAVHGYGARNAFKYASGLARKLGSAFIVLGIADGNDLSEPVNLNNIQSIDWMFVYDCYDLTRTVINDQEFFQLSNDANQLIHPNRVLNFYGNKLDTEIEYVNSNYRHDSVINLMFEAFSNWVTGSKAIYEMLLTGNMYTFGIEDLSEDVKRDIDQGTTEYQDYMRSRAESVKTGMSATNLLIYDKMHELVENISRNFSGTKESFEALQDTLASVVDMPRWKLYNEFGTAGLAASVESARILQFNWAISVQDWQIENWLEPVYKLCQFCMSAKNLYGSIVDNFGENSIIFPIQLKLTKLEEIELENLAMDRNQKLLLMGAISPDEVRKQYENSVFNPNITLDNNLYKAYQNKKEQEQKMILNQNNLNNKDNSGNNKNDKNSSK
ncbi:hypothetical protein NIES2100_05520 [Calothrix sp. NIES-2100]|uniref:anti-CBASS protein Acb1 family protein n=1 Tax=Calothrix sp. NIES-2100 TaxID=1954172 RepID=UPI000B601E05|nr:hypothetical protein NIES2100_05520 [Calothrix sp. NIES-2100]